jgi:hypothetical protein
VVSDVYGRQELPDEPGASPEPYLWLLSQRLQDGRQPEASVQHSDLRRRLFLLMAIDPEAEWTAQALATTIAVDALADPDVAVFGTQAIGEELNALMADRWVEPVPFQRALTVRLTADGHLRLRQLLLAWSADERRADGDA